MQLLQPSWSKQQHSHFLELRPFRPSDLAEALTVFREAVHRCAARDYSPEQLAVWAPRLIDAGAWARKRTSRRTWVAERSGEVIGLSDLGPDGSIELLYVHPDHEGSGVGQALLAEVELAAREDGLARLHADVSLTGRRCFSRRDFHTAGPEIRDIAGQPLMVFAMEKGLRLHA